ncbi:S8 family peptidase [Bacillus sp. HNG]|uniref:S8 family peptidase n=1 Tax=Bacillus sp. HNG TaxID=2293325 RepID=UPI0026D252BA
MKFISKLLSVILIAVLFSSLFAIGVFAAPEQGESSNNNLRVLIQPLNKNDKSKLMSTYGARWDFESKGFTTNVNEQQYTALLKNKNLKISIVDTVSIAAKPKAGGEVVPSDRTPWGIEAIYNDPLIASTDGGDNIRVAVLDTGTNINHTDLQANVEQCKDFSQNKSPLINGSCADKNGHGTHVAGTVLANGGNGTGIYGVAPDAKLWAYRVLGNSGFGYSDDIAAAIRHAADEGKKNGVKVVISMSLGSSSKDSLIADAVTYAVNSGALVVAAAGNEGPAPNTIGFPGGLHDAIAVAALENVLQNGSYRIADFSSRGNPSTAGDFVIGERDVELSAPGRAIESTWSDGTYNTISGTSMATPHISGLAAKIWAENPSMTNYQIRAELQNRAKSNDIKAGQYAGAGDDIASGFGFPLVK